MDEKLEHARRRWLAQRDDPSEREYHVALERAGWPWETAHLQRIGGWRLERVLCGYTLGSHACSAAAFTPDSRRLVTSDASRVRVWDVATGRRVRGGGPIAEETDVLSLSPDGESVLFVPGRWRGASPAELWRLDPWGRLATFALDGARLDDVTYLADGSIVSLHGDGIARVWRVDGAAVEREVVHGDPPHAYGRGRVVARPGGGFVTIVGGDPRPMVWPASGARGRRCARPTHFGAQAGEPALAVSPDGRRAAASWPGVTRGGGDDGGLALFDLSTFDVIAQRRGQEGVAAFTSDAVLVGGSTSFELLGADDLSDRDIFQIVGAGRAVATSPDGGLMCLGGALMGTRSWHEPAPAPHRGPIEHVGFTPGTTRAASVMKQAVLVWDLESGRLDQTLPTSAPATLDSHGRGALDPGGSVVHRLDLRTFEKRPIAGLRGARPLAFQVSGSLVAETTRDGVVVVDLSDGSRRWSWSDPAGRWGAVAAFSVDDRRLFLAGREGLVAFDAASGAVRFNHSWPEDEVSLRSRSGTHVRALAASPVEGGLVVLTTDARLVTFDASTGTLRGVAALDGQADGLRVGARGDMVFLQDDRGWRAVDAHTGREVATPPSEQSCPVDFRLPLEAEERASALAVSDEGQRLLMGTNAGSLLLYTR